METVIKFDTSAGFSQDPHIADALKGIARISDRPGPIPVQNVTEMGFKNPWWQFWK